MSDNRPLIDLQPLHPEQYQQVAAWNYDDISDVDWEAYAAILEAPNRINYAVYSDSRFCAYVGMERFGTTVRFHIAKEYGALHPFSVANLLVQIADYLFSNGIESLDCIVPRGYRPSRILALRCGMSFRGRVADGERYSITRSEFEDQHGQQETSDRNPSPATAKPAICQ